MSTIRYIRKDPSQIAAFHGVLWGGEEQYIDTLIEGDEEDIPADAIYAALLDDQGIYSEIVVAPIDLTFAHHFAGWDPHTFPRPTLP
jgi:hypothetical protein